MPVSSKFSRKLLLVESTMLKLHSFNNYRRCWVHDINKLRSTEGEFEILYKKLRNYNDKFFDYLRMTKNTFDLLQIKIGNDLQKQDTNYRSCISPEQRLVLTLRYLATGESFRSLAFHFRLGRSTVANIVKDTCSILWNSLKNEYLPVPTTAKWQEIAQEFYDLWNFPNCIGAIDGKHIRVICPAHSGSVYYNYKQYYSILLQAVVDASSRIIAVDIGTEGRQCDSGNFRSSTLFHLLETDSLNVPPAKEIPGTNIKLPHVLIGDGGYPLLNYLMRPYGQRNIDNMKQVYNYRLSRARESVECCFGIMTTKWRILMKAIETNIDTAKIITKAVCILHNFVLKHENMQMNEISQEAVILSGEHRRSSHYRFSNNALQTREILLNYFNGIGAIQYQDNLALPENIIQQHDTNR